MGLALCSNVGEIAAALGRITAGRWLAERRVHGIELTVGLLDGRAMGVVEIAPKTGVYDYTNKYTKGNTEYFAPARIAPGAASAVQHFAEGVFAACGCRDFARVDFILSDDGVPYALEINTIPGFTTHSLLPKAAARAGLSMSQLCVRIVQTSFYRKPVQQNVRTVDSDSVCF